MLEALPLEENSNDFGFDNQMLTQIVYFGFGIGEVSCPTRYTAESSSIGFPRAVGYGFQCLAASVQFVTARAGIYTPRFLSREGRRLEATDGSGRG